MKGVSDEKTRILTNLLLRPKIRLEYVDPGRNHNKFYEIETESALFYPKIIKRWGRIGGQNPRVLNMEHSDYLAFNKDISNTLKRRFHHGYKIVK